MMHVRLVSQWPFFRLVPSEVELAAKRALERFDRAEKRCRRSNLDEIEEEIQELAEKTQKLREKNAYPRGK